LKVRFYAYHIDTVFDKVKKNQRKIELIYQIDDVNNIRQNFSITILANTFKLKLFIKNLSV